MDTLTSGRISTALKQERERQGTSLQDISQAVNVPVRYLQALEGEGDRRLLADTMYLIPFLRTYVTYLGFDPNSAVRQFISELQTREMTEAKSRLESSLSPARFSAWILPLVVALGGLLMVALVLRFSGLGTRWPFGQQEEISSAVLSSDEPVASMDEFVAPMPEEDALRGRQENVSAERAGQAGQAEQAEQQVREEEPTALVPAATQGERSQASQPEAVAQGEAPAAALPSALPASITSSAPTLSVSQTPQVPSGSHQPEQAEQQVREEEPTALVPAAALPSALPASITSSAPTLSVSQTPQVPSGSHQLRVHTVEETWLRVVIDGEETKDVLLSPNQQMEWEARSHFMLTVGNAGGIEMELDGNPLPSLGQSGEVVRQLRLPAVE